VSAASKALRYLLDTNVVIGLLQGQAASIALIQSANCQLSEMAVSQITRLELLGFAGISAKEVQAINGFLASIQVLPISGEVEDQVIALRQSRKIKLPDAIVAATALAHGLELMTLDQSLARSFQGMVA
jgi:predicted nucleic acid-binding protein